MTNTKAVRGRFEMRVAWTAASALALFALAGCGGGDNPSTGAGVTQISVEGTAAVGAPMAGASILVVDTKGAAVTATADSNGHYTASVTGMAAPLVVLASDPGGVDAPQVSVVPSIGAVSTVVANVTTLTTAIGALLTSTGNPTDLVTHSSTLATVTPANVAAAIKNLKTALSPILAANNVDAATFDPIGTPFTADDTGLDAVIDAVQVLPAPAGGVELLSTADSTSAITLNSAANISTALAVPPMAAGYLRPLMSSLSQCLNGTSAACGQSIDAQYLSNGFTSLTKAHPALAAPGVTLGVPRTLAFFLFNSTERAWIQLPYHAPNGNDGSIVTVVQELSDGTWDIIGNQELYDVTISSFVARRQFQDPTGAKFSRYEAGLSINVPVGAVGTPNPIDLASVGISGPGINGTLYLTPRAGVGNGLLGLTSTAQASPPLNGALSNSNTSLYRWSWQALGGSANGTFVPGNGELGFYTPSPIDVSQVPRFARYAVTFYNSGGFRIGPIWTTVVNASPTLSAAAGQGVLWQSLSSDSLTNFLSPSGTLAGQQTTAPLSWSNLVNGANSAPLVGKVQVQATPGAGMNASAVDGWWIGPSQFAINGSYAATVTAGIDQAGVQQCSSPCVYPALQPGASRLVELGWGAGQIEYLNMWQYND